MPAAGASVFPEEDGVSLSVDGREWRGVRSCRVPEAVEEKCATHFDFFEEVWNHNGRRYACKPPCNPLVTPPLSLPVLASLGRLLYISVVCPVFSLLALLCNNLEVARRN